MKSIWTHRVITFFCTLLMAALIVLPDLVMATQETQPVASDHRLRTYVYDPNEVYKFVGHYRYQSSIELAPGEEIATISLGDSLGWQVSPSGNRLFLKPIEKDATTNMTIITNKRIYHFELYGQEAEGIDDSEMIFAARFHYPNEGVDKDIQRFLLDEGPDIDIAPEKYNFRYSLSGSEYISPLKIFDDGEFTYFEFKNKNAEIPAFFLVDPDGAESVVNYRMNGPYVVVERVSSQFTLRSGPDVVCVYNETMPLRPKKPDPERKFLGIL